jgi:hypothetical protein
MGGETRAGAQIHEKYDDKDEKEKRENFLASLFL